MQHVRQNEVLEIQCTSLHAAPDKDLVLDVKVLDPHGREMIVPGFWAGGNEWHFRVSASEPGKYTYTTTCSDPGDTGLQERSGEFEVIPNTGGTSVAIHG
nr:DUF5060 domain-containing protein [Candidatus Sigynarchaeota archaeon]